MTEHIEHIKIVTYQVGVDVLGFPIYEQHFLVDGYQTKPQTFKSGKNMSKNKFVPKFFSLIFREQTKQF